MTGAAINILGKVIAGCGGKLALGFKVRMPGNYTPLYGAIDQKKQQRMFTDWHEKLPVIGNALK